MRYRHERRTNKLVSTTTICRLIAGHVLTEPISTAYIWA